LLSIFLTKKWFHHSQLSDMVQVVPENLSIETTVPKALTVKEKHHFLIDFGGSEESVAFEKKISGARNDRCV
jgi:hypothetical protein